MTIATASIPTRDRLPWSRTSPGSLPTRPGVGSAGTTASDDVHLSHSQCRTYTGCSLQWFLSRRYPPESVPANLVFGAAFHAALDAYYQAKLEGREATLDDLLSAYENHWTEEREGKHVRPPATVPAPVKFTGKEEDEAGMRALAERMLAAFLEYQVGRTSQVIAIEEEFRVEVAGDLPPLVGRVDLVEIVTGDDGARTLCLVDFKTSARKPSLDDLGTDQLLIYGKAAVGMGLVNAYQLPVSLRYLVITKVKSPEVHIVEVENTPREWSRLAEKIRQVWRGMRAEVVYPSPSWRCSGCGHARLCGAWPVLEAAPPLAASA